MHNRWHPDLEPIAEVAPGEEIRLETADGLDGQLTRESTHADAGTLDLGLGHPLTGPVYVQGAEPGDVLEVELLRYETDDFGTTAVIPGFGYLADLFPDPYLVKWEIDGGLARSEELPGVAVPEDAFAGVIGVAPSHERLEAIRQREETLCVARHQPVTGLLTLLSPTISTSTTSPFAIGATPDGVPVATMSPGSSVIT